MSPTSEEIELGEKAYRWVQFYEKYGARNLRQLPWILAVCVVTLGVISFYHYKYLFAPFFFLIFSFSVYGVQNWVAKERYANNKMILQLLKDKYGDALPWVVEEKQLARARELEVEIARARQTSHA